RLQRDLTLPAARDYRVAGTVRVSSSVPDATLQRLLGQDAAVTATASSRAFDDPVLAATAAVDVAGSRPDLRTAWQPADPAVGQWLDVAFPTARIDGLTVTQPAAGATVVRATVTVDGSRSYDVQLGPGRVRVPIPAQTARSVRITVRGRVGDGPVRIEDVAVSGLRGSRPASSAPTVPAPCVTVATVDGRPIRVRPLAPAARVAAGAAVQFAGCTGTPLGLDAGPHRIRGVPDWSVDTLQLRDTTASAHASTGAAAVDAPQVLSTSDTGATVRTAATSTTTYLVAGRGFDPGWVARADGRDLGPPVLVDGYSAGWRLPPGPGHVVEIVYGPRTRAMTAGAASMAAVAGCIVLAVLPALRRRRLPLRRTPPPAAAGPPPAPAPVPVPATSTRRENDDRA
ncbi:MAG TPA: hypothetical protein VEV65_12795, partial [Kineosporiaceae bacterium]|nr:hypothetical protein [Kineosporiaceae bacterium]